MTEDFKTVIELQKTLLNELQIIRQNQESMQQRISAIESTMQGIKQDDL